MFATRSSRLWRGNSREFETTDYGPRTTGLNMRDYTKIEAWKLADDLTVAVYERTRSFPSETTDHKTTDHGQQTSPYESGNTEEGKGRRKQKNSPISPQKLARSLRCKGCSWQLVSKPT